MALRTTPTRKRPASKRPVGTQTKASSVDIASKIKPISEMASNTTGLIYGRSGTGKTEIATTFPTPLLHIDIRERGTDTILTKPGVEGIQVNSWAEMTDLYWYLKTEAVGKYKSIVTDQITSLQDLGTEEIRIRSKKESTEVFSKRMWGQLSGLLKEQVQLYRDLRDHYNVVFIAHERMFSPDEEEDETGTIAPHIGPRVMPSVGDFLSGAVDFIGNTFIREDFVGKGKDETRVIQYCMRVGPHAFYSTKIRRPVELGPVPEFIVDPTYQKIRALISGKKLMTKKPMHRR